MYEDPQSFISIMVRMTTFFTAHCPLTMSAYIMLQYKWGRRQLFWQKLVLNNVAAPKIKPKLFFLLFGNLEKLQLCHKKSKQGKAIRNYTVRLKDCFWENAPSLSFKLYAMGKIWEWPKWWVVAIQIIKHLESYNCPDLQNCHLSGNGCKSYQDIFFMTKLKHGNYLSSKCSSESSIPETRSTAYSSNRTQYR